jgi:hypothetical protein
MLLSVLGVSLLLAGNAQPAASVAIQSGGREADTIVVQSTAGQIIEQFRGWRASVSPDGRFVAYGAYEPTQSPPVPCRLVLYDLSAAASGAAGNARTSLYPQEGTTGALHSPLVWIATRRLAFLDVSDMSARVVLIDVNDGIPTPRLHTRDLDLSQIVIREELGPGQTPGSVVFVDAITTYKANEEGTGITLNLVDGPAIDGVSVSLAVK